MKTEIKVLKCLIKGMKSCTIKELSRQTGADYKIIHTAVQQLLKKSVVEARTVGNSTEVRFIPKFTQEVFEAEMEMRQELLKKSDFMLLHRRLEDVKTPFIALVFGSYAKGTATKHSDIDIMVVCEKMREKEVESKVSLLSLDIHLLTFTYEEFLQMANSKEFTVGSEAMKNRIILTGIEDYYRLIKDVGQ